MEKTPTMNLTHKTVTNDHIVDEALLHALYNVYHTEHCKFKTVHV